MSRVVLDASAILAVAFNEAGCEQVLEYKDSATVSAVNQTEVISKLLRFEMPLPEIETFLSEAFPSVVAFDKRQASLAADIHQQNRHHRISYADASCMALATLNQSPVITGDRKWAEIPLSIAIRLFR